MNQAHIILGSGPVGASTAARLGRAGLSPVLISRNKPAQLPAGVTHRAGDVLDDDFMRAACADAAVIYQCLNAPYHLWESTFPPLQRAALKAASAAKARYISFENVYMYGMPGATPFDEDSPHAPCAKKGVVRAKMAQELDVLRAEGALEIVQVRASDLFGPSMHMSALGDEVFGRIARGLKPRVLGDPHQAHSWAYVEDTAEAMAACGLATSPPAVLHVPNDSPRSTHELLELIGELVGRPMPYTVTPAWLLRLIGLFKPEVGAIIEMAYEFDRPFIVNSKHAQAMGLHPTPIKEALRQTLQAFGHEALPVAA